MGTIEQGVKQAVENCLKVQPGEKALIITDMQTIEIGSALNAAIERIAGKVEFFVMEDFGTRPIDLPPAIEDALRSADVSVYAAQGADGELQTFRMPMLKAIMANTALRHAHMVGITPQIMCDGMCSDYKQIQRTSRLVHEKVRDAGRIEVITEKGCNFTATFSPELRWAIEDGDIQPGRPRNLPDGEVATCPIDVSGTAVIDGCLGDIFARECGFLGDTPIIVDIEYGRAIRDNIKCVDEQLRMKFTNYLFENDKNSNRIGEFAIGTNTGLSRLIYNILQDEKFPGVHIAFGHPANPDETGADWECSTHLDGVINNPTIVVDDVTIMDKGQFRLE